MPVKKKGQYYIEMTKSSHNPQFEVEAGYLVCKKPPASQPEHFALPLFSNKNQETLVSFSHVQSHMNR